MSGDNWYSKAYKQKYLPHLILEERRKNIKQEIKVIDTSNEDIENNETNALKEIYDQYNNQSLLEGLKGDGVPVEVFLQKLQEQLKLEEQILKKKKLKKKILFNFLKITGAMAFFGMVIYFIF